MLAGLAQFLKKLRTVLLPRRNTFFLTRFSRITFKFHDVKSECALRLAPFTIRNYHCACRLPRRLTCRTILTQYNLNDRQMMICVADISWVKCKGTNLIKRHLRLVAPARRHVVVITSAPPLSLCLVVEQNHHVSP